MHVFIVYNELKMSTVQSKSVVILVYKSTGYFLAGNTTV
jgi:hypothetical protein